MTSCQLTIMCPAPTNSWAVQSTILMKPISRGPRWNSPVSGLPLRERRFESHSQGPGSLCCSGGGFRPERRQAGNSTRDILVQPSPFFPGVLLSRKPPETQGNGRFLKRTMVGKNGESTQKDMGSVPNLSQRRKPQARLFVDSKESLRPSTQQGAK